MESDIQKKRKAISKRYYQRHRKECLKRTSDWWKKNREKLRLKWRKKYWKNPEVGRAKQRARRQRKLEQYRASNRDWQKRTWNQRASKRLAAANRRRALKKLATINEAQIIAWMELMKSKAVVSCYYCSTKIRNGDFHFDHIVALSKGGPHCVENLCVACPDCNRKKSAKPIRAWIKTGQQILEL